MSRISSSSFKVNSDLEQLVAITNTTAIPTSDSIAQSSLSSIASNTTGLAGCVSGGELQVDVVSSAAIAVTNSDLTSLGGCVSGSEVQVDIVSAPTLAVSNAGLTALSGAISGSEVQCDIVSSAAIAVTNSDLTDLGGCVSAGRVLVTTEAGSSNNNGSKGNLSNAASVTSGTFSSEIDTRASKNITILGVSTDVNNQIEIHISANSGSDYVKYQYGIFPDSSGNFSASLPNVAINYIKLKYTGTATVTATLLHN